MWPRTRSLVLAAVTMVVPGCGLIVGIEDGVLDPDLLEASVSDGAGAETAADAGDAIGPAIDAADGKTVTCTESGAKQLAGHCYFVLPTDEALSQGKAACIALGAHLVTITSAAEQSFLATSFGFAKRRWIGLEAPSTTSNRASFKWITGEVSAYEHWLSGEPNQDGPCAVMGADIGSSSNSDQWVDRACDSTYEQICERE